MTPDLVCRNCRVATMANGRYGIMENAAIGIAGQKIAWIAPMADLPPCPPDVTAVDCRNGWVLPGFVDCHTHLIWAGSRSAEFEQRGAGMSYTEIAQQGGGIMATVRATRAASGDRLFHLAADRLSHFLSRGITTVEIKSGYGLDIPTELAILSVIGRLKNAVPQHIEATFLGAHALPPEFSGRPRAYVDMLITTLMPRVREQGIATAVDVFCESIGFSLDDTRRIFSRALELGFRLKLHAEQLSDSSGAALAASLGALSCDHLEYLSPEGAHAMADHGTVAVLLPGAFHYLKETRVPPVDRLRHLGVPMAVSTDLNPGTSPVFDMLPILNMACLLFGLTCEEALAGATLHGARALGLADRKGSLEPGKDADLVLWDVKTPADLCSITGLTPVRLVVINGKIVYPAP